MCGGRPAASSIDGEYGYLDNMLNLLMISQALGVIPAMRALIRQMWV